MRNAIFMGLGNPGSFNRLFIISALIYAYFVGGYLSNTMTNSMATLTIALIDDRSLIIDKYTQHDRDVSRSENHLYSGMPPGLSIFLIPVYLGMKIPLALIPNSILNKLDDTVTRGLQEKHTGFHPSEKRALILLLLIFGVVFLAAPFTLILGYYFITIYQSLYPNQKRLLLPLLCFLLLGTGIADFTATIYHTTIATVIVWVTFVNWMENFGKQRKPKELIFIGMALGTIPPLDYPAIIYPAILLPAILLSQPKKGRLKSGLKILLGAAIPITLMALYHTLAFGKPWLTAYHMRIVNLEHHFQNLNGIWKVIPDTQRIVRIFTDSRCNLPLFNPLLPLGLIASGFHYYKAKEEKLKFLWATAFLLMLVNISYYGAIPMSLNPSGGSYGARYTIYSVPFGLLALVPFFSKLFKTVGKNIFYIILALFSMPAWMYLFYGSPNRPIGTYLDYLMHIGPTNYTLFKAYEAGWIKNPLFFSYCGIFILSLISYGIWKIDFKNLSKTAGV